MHTRTCSHIISQLLSYSRYINFHILSLHGTVWQWYYCRHYYCYYCHLFHPNKILVTFAINNLLFILYCFWSICPVLIRDREIAIIMHHTFAWINFWLCFLDEGLQWCLFSSLYKTISTTMVCGIDSLSRFMYNLWSRFYSLPKDTGNGTSALV